MLANSESRYRIWDYLLAQSMLSDRCVEHYFLSGFTWSTRLIPAHSLCSILTIVHFRKVASDCPIKNAILDCSKSPPRRNYKRHPDRDDQPPSKRQKSNCSSSKSNAIPNSISRVQQYTEHETFDSSLLLEPNTAVETEMDILYDEAEKRAALIQDLVDEGDKATARDCAVAFAVMDQLEAEQDDEDETETVGGPSLVWDHNSELVQLQNPTTTTASSSTPSKKSVQFNLSGSAPSRDCSNDSAPSSVPTPVESDEFTRSSSFNRSCTDDDDSYEGSSQMTLSMDIPTVPNRPKTSTRDEREVSLNERSDNAMDPNFTEPGT